MRSTSRALSSLAAFRRSSGGNIAILTALMLVPVMGIAGLAVDYSISSLQHSRLTALADSTALLGARRAKEIIEEGVGSINSRIEALEGQLVKHFASQSSNIVGVQKTVNVVRNGLNIQVSVDWGVSIPSVFGRLYGQNSYQIAGQSASTVSVRPYIHLIVLLDVSQSMGIGATQSDQQRMFNREGCMFACHLPPRVSSSRIDNNKTTYQTAREASPPINTRVDVARDGLHKIVDLAEKEAEGSSERVKLGVYTYSNKVTPVVPINDPIASDFGRIRTRVNAITLGTEGGGSDIMLALNEIRSLVQRSGDGSSSDNPRVFVLLLSDGVANSTLAHQRPDGGFDMSAAQPFHSRRPAELDSIQNPRSDDVSGSPNASQVTVRGVVQIDAGRIGAMDERACRALKDRSVTMMVIATEYVIPHTPYRAKTAGVPGDDLRFEWFSTSGRLGAITDRMRACASDNYFVSVRDGAAIENAMKEMGALALKSHLRLAR